MNDENEREHDSKDDGCWGCGKTIVGVLIIWAFLFGVTYGGKHHGVSCSCDRGVEVK